MFYYIIKYRKYQNNKFEKEVLFLLKKKKKELMSVSISAF